VHELRPSDPPPREEPAEVLTRKTLVYRASRGSTMVWLYVLHRLRVRGREHVPASGGALIVSNHQSFLDIPVIAAATRRHVSFVARDTLAETRWLAFVMRGCGAVLLKRGTADRKGLTAMIRHLELGDCVSIFPEGTRSTDGRLGEFHGGALVAARRTGVPIVPAAIRGAFEAFPRGARLPRPKRISIEFGAPVDPRAPDALELVRGRVQALLGDGRFDPRS
jgi:1-acyl-sn-glycerol-3-phosphate acyltransferase